MIRERISDPWREVSWDEATGYAASEGHQSRAILDDLLSAQGVSGAEAGARRLQQQQHRHLRPGLSFADRLWPEDHLRHTRRDAGFESVEHTDVILVIGANPTDGHPVFASRMKRRLRKGAKLIVIDPRRIDLVRTPHIQADFHLPLRPGANVAVLTSMAHVVVTEDLVDQAYVAERCDPESFAEWAEFVARPEHSPEAMKEASGVPAADLRAAARLHATGGHAAIHYGLGGL